VQNADLTGEEVITLANEAAKWARAKSGDNKERDAQGKLVLVNNFNDLDYVII
jgi:hypothetical protein